MPTKSEFITNMYPHAKNVGEEIGINPNWIVAHWYHESEYGNNTGAENNNYAGIYAYKGSPYGINGKKYSTIEDFEKDYITTVTQKRYNQINQATNVTEFAKALKVGGYAEDPAYYQSGNWQEADNLVSKLISGITTPSPTPTPTTTTTPSPTKTPMPSSYKTPKPTEVEEKTESKIPNFLTQPSQFMEWLQGQFRLTFMTVLIFCLCLILLYAIFLKGGAVEKNVQRVSKAVVSKGLSEIPKGGE